MPKAASNYKQIRLTLTESPTRVDWRIMVKPINLEWNQKHTVLVGSEHRPIGGLETYESVLMLLIELLEAQLLPRSH